MSAVDVLGDASSPMNVSDAVFERNAARAAWAFVALGIVVRLVRFALAFPLWGDEAMLALNFHDRDYVGLMQGLDYCQVAPLGYLWAQKAVVDFFGFNDYSLRTISLISGIAALVVFRIAAGHILRGWSLVFAVGVFSVAYYPIRHAVEVKPYAGDLLAAALLLEPFLAWLARPDRLRPLWRLAATAIVVVPFSFTAAFVGGGVSLAIAVEAYRRRDRCVVAPWIAFNLALVGTFGLLYFTVMRNDYSVNGHGMRTYWQEGFPPSLGQWTEWPAWLLRAHGGESMAYPFGGDNGGSIVQLCLAIVGAVAVLRSRYRGLVTVAGTMLLVAFAAAVLHRYPYGHGERLQQYLAPTACLLIGCGLTVTGSLFFRSAVSVRRSRVAFAGLLVLLGTGFCVSDTLKPYKSRYDADHRDFSRRLWRSDSPDEPLLELSDDLEAELYHRDGPLLARLYKYVYEPKSAAMQADAVAERLAALPPGKPIRCVAIFRGSETADPAAYASWQQAMSRDYYPVSEATHELKYDRDELAYVYRIWRFEPKSPAARPLTALQPAKTQAR